MQEKKQTSAVTKWMTLIIVAIAGGLMTKGLKWKLRG